MKQQLKRFLTLFLAVLLSVSLLPVSALAEEAEEEVAVKVKASDPAKTVPSFTLKTSGKPDVLRTGSGLVLTPVLKNCYSCDITVYDVRFVRWEGNEWQRTDEKDAGPNGLYVKCEVRDGSWVITPGEKLQANATLSVKIPIG